MALLTPQDITNKYNATVEDLLLQVLNNLPIPNDDPNSFLNGQLQFKTIPDSVGPAGFYTSQVALGNAQRSSLFDVELDIINNVGGSIFYTCIVNCDSDSQIISGSCNFVVVSNKVPFAGSIITEPAEVKAEIKTGGTLTKLFEIIQNGTKAEICVTISSSLSAINSIDFFFMLYSGVGNGITLL